MEDSVIRYDKWLTARLKEDKIYVSMSIAVNMVLTCSELTFEERSELVRPMQNKISDIINNYTKRYTRIYMSNEE